jgi:transcription-repair coupling factor (superfamily II helicase)
MGFSWLETGIDFITETELFAIAPAARRRKKQEQVSDVEALIKDLSELNVGDPVVHNTHGIGRYRGLVNMDLGEKTDDGLPVLQEFLHLEYADQAVLYVPVSQLHLIGRYTGVSADEAPSAQTGFCPMGQSQTPRSRTSSRCCSRIAQYLRASRCAGWTPVSLFSARLRNLCQRLSVLKKLQTNAPPSMR